MSKVDLAAIRAALNTAYDGFHWFVKQELTDNAFETNFSEPEANLVANVPAWLHQLCDEVEVLRKHILSAPHPGMCSSWDDLECDCWKSKVLEDKGDE